jgi:hypothetical protein
MNKRAEGQALRVIFSIDAKELKSYNKVKIRR